MLQNQQIFPIDMILFLIFLVLKLTNHIAWSWWWITSPLWIPLVLSITVFIIIFLFLLIKSIIMGRI